MELIQRYKDLLKDIILNIDELEDYVSSKLDKTKAYMYDVYHDKVYCVDKYTSYNCLNQVPYGNPTFIHIEDSNRESAVLLVSLFGKRVKLNQRKIPINPIFNDYIFNPLDDLSLVFSMLMIEKAIHLKLAE